MTNPRVYLKSTNNFSDIITPMLKDMYDDVISQPGKGNAKSSQGVPGISPIRNHTILTRKGAKFSWATTGYDVKRATEKARAQTPLQNIIDGEVKKLGGR